MYSQLILAALISITLDQVTTTSSTNGIVVEYCISTMIYYEPSSCVFVYSSNGSEISSHISTASRGSGPYSLSSSLHTSSGFPKISEVSELLFVTTTAYSSGNGSSNYDRSAIEILSTSTSFDTSTSSSSNGYPSATATSGPDDDPQDEDFSLELLHTSEFRFPQSACNHNYLGASL
ncbi:hypothetical protein SBOR_8397 [Sclerotinia borealis F-4128]|uniref:Uncharacterized protein n=1 Tax=Sclerotinia borealis (strain F-4128) TaxID=1432307 RepID=W9C645_SCLBF|nr:hypothetical protein SBOR_8397 [Sclerotinia borealis F-4128]